MSQTSNDDIFDLVGLGFGPANIAIAGALTEHWQTKDSLKKPMTNVLFIEKHKHFRWHPGMLLPEAKMQISFMKDLATLRNPQSPYTFLSYLHSQDRLLPFINRGSTIPTRKEYSDYLSWAAQRVQEEGINVLYGHEVVCIANSNTKDTVAIHYRNVTTGEEVVVKSRNIIISPGGSPRVPPSISHVAKHPNVIHSSTYCLSIPKILETIAKASQLGTLRIAVIGSGQSAAEVTMDLRNRLNDIPCQMGHHQVDMLIRKGSLKPSDDSPFANEIFNPASTDIWFSLSSKRIRDMKLAEYKPTNYGVVNPRTIDALYEIIYGQKVNDDIVQRTGVSLTSSETIIDIKTYVSISSIEPTTSDTSTIQLLSSERFVDTNAALVITTQNLITHESRETLYDAVVYATGYERSHWADVLKKSDVGKHFGLDRLCTDIRLIPAPGREARSSQPKSISSSRSTSTTHSLPSSTDTTPPTSPEIGASVLERGQQLYISRNYRLLPLGKGRGDSAHFEPRIYVQGVEEYTHGLSDTLLSVLGVRAGEVVEDLTRD
ncbi:hypothetical protein BDN70DRAFT_911055 [Pholiota conissans]|uniref:L-ornithine N(5)-monooxygenase [NAD(P)H] n=1 Tax=Pholiota conissans TaxID=109636 RepID=A0A9P5ZAB0_9AGAR|nr:hypothetical protein BDN70DRAFT_911055 [Pholiota conissans]